MWTLCGVCIFCTDWHGIRGAQQRPLAGAQVGPNSVQLDATKLTTIVDWHQPSDLLNLSHFLGLAGYFHDLVKVYAKIAQPLSGLVHCAAIPKGAGKAAYRAALSRVKLANIWTCTHESTFLSFKKVLTSEPVLKASHFDSIPFIIILDRCKEGFSGMLAQQFNKTRTGGKIIEKLHPIAYTSKCTSPSEANYKPFLLEFAALKFCTDKFNSIIWGFPVAVETDCQALCDTILSDNLNATHVRWHDGVLSHQIMDV
jgi:hypothetical protein